MDIDNDHMPSLYNSKTIKSFEQVYELFNNYPKPIHLDGLKISDWRCKNVKYLYLF